MARILFISTEFPPGPGGIGTHAYQVSKHLRNFEHELLVASPQDYSSESEIHTFNSHLPYPVHRFSHYPGVLFEGPIRTWQTLKLCKKFKPNLLLASGSRAAWMAYVINAMTHIPFIVVGHGTEFGSKVNWERFLTKRSFSTAEAIICVSQFTLGKVKELGIDHTKTYIIHNGANSKIYYPNDPSSSREFRKNAGVEDGFILLTVGNITDRKGQDIVIRSLSKVIDRYPNVYYWIVGLPTQSDKLMELAKSLSVENHVHFWGAVDNHMLPEIYNAADLFILTSRMTTEGDFEGFGIVVIEAALCGKPAIVSSGSGLQEAVNHEQTGLVVPPDDPDSTADAILRLIDNPDELTRLGQNALKHNSNNRSWHTVAKDYHEIIKSTIS